MARASTATRLRPYARKRDFTRSPEPKPETAAVSPKRSKLRFCVQQHLASTLHYDLRLEHAGVLLSWAVPKGPSLNPADKRLAVHVEDHPIGYRTFEGVIPSGYGAGVVVLWDEGTWRPLTRDVDRAMQDGELKFELDGVKLKGSWVLVRTKRAAAQEHWLLIKHRDHWAGDVDVVSAAPESVKSFGGLADVLANSPDASRLDPKWVAAGGAAGKLLRDVIATAAEIAKGGAKPKRSTAAPKERKPASSRRKSWAASVSKREELKLTNPLKVLYPRTGFTKGDLVDYYTRVARLILPHLRGRAVTLKRYPDGVDGKFFFEKRCPSHRPDWVQTAAVPSRHAGTIHYCRIEDLPTLMWTANLAAIELHVPMALAENPDRPIAMVFDLDPGPSVTTPQLCRTAVRVRDVLADLGLQSFVKTSGSKGLHLLVPLNTAEVTFDDTKAVAHAIALMAQRNDPAGVTATMSKSARVGKVFIDWSQNDRAKTTVSVYSARAKDRPYLSTPLEWKQVERRRFTSRLCTDKVEPIDAFAEVLTLRQSLPAIGGRLKSR